jgi:hypothetical protein
VRAAAKRAAATAQAARHGRKGVDDEGLSS